MSSSAIGTRLDRPVTIGWIARYQRSEYQRSTHDGDIGARPAAAASDKAATARPQPIDGRVAFKGWQS